MKERKVKKNTDMPIDFGISDPILNEKLQKFYQGLSTIPELQNDFVDLINEVDMYGYHTGYESGETIGEAF